jgi:uncharacterized RDD family membrane protein YckC
VTDGVSAAGRTGAGERGSAAVSAGFLRRAAALIYDAFLLVGLLMVFTGGALFLTKGHAILAETAGSWVYLYRAGLVAVVASYYIVNWLRSGQTLGMRAWRIRAVSPTGTAMDLGAAMLRAGFGFLAWAPAALGVLWMYLDPGHLALHDRISRTRVVRSTRS